MKRGIKIMLTVFTAIFMVGVETEYSVNIINERQKIINTVNLNPRDNGIVANKLPNSRRK